MKKRFSIKQHKTEEHKGQLSPVTFRLPRTGTTDPYFGVPRTFWNQRVLPNALNNFRPPIKSIVVKTTGTTRGIRLIVFDSAKAYFDALATAQTAEVSS